MPSLMLTDTKEKEHSHPHQMFDNGHVIAFWMSSHII